MKRILISPLFLISLALPALGAEGILDYNKFMRDIEPLFTIKTYANPGPSLMSCIDCHGDPTNLAYSTFTLRAGQSRANFIEVGEEITLSDPDTSLLLLKPLANAGGGVFHGTYSYVGGGEDGAGGKQFGTVQDADYQTILTWIIEATQSDSAKITQTEPHPNPFRRYTDIVYFLSTPALDVSVTIFTNDGHELISYVGPTLVGANKVRWDGRDSTGEPLPTGLYFYAVRARFDDGTSVKTSRIVFTP